MTIIREQLILADEAIVGAVSSIKTTTRSMMKYEDLQKFAVTQIPVAAVVGKLPKAEHYHRSGRKREIIGQVQSILKVETFVYFQCTNPKTMDSEVSTFANALWSALFADPSRGGLCIETLVDVEPDYLYWDPFVAFKVIASHLYVHDTGGI